MWWALLVACLPADTVGSLEGQCGSCHTEQAEAFAESRHAVAATSETFASLRESMGEPATCDRCHRPDVGTEHGLSCVTCHAAVGNLDTRDGLLVHDLGGPVQAAAVGQDAPHRSAVGFASDSALCGTCHEVSGPGPFEETPFTEWAEGPAEETCVDCHFADHRFVGLQTDGLALLREAVGLEAVEGGVRIVNRNPGHALPSGASIMRRLDLVVDGVVVESLAAQPTLGGVPVSLEEADGAEHRSIPAGGSRMVAAEGEQACVVFELVREELPGGTAPETVACLDLHGDH